MKQKIEVPDKEIKLSRGDYVKIYVSKNKILFSVYCNQDGCEWELTKDELKEMLKTGDLLKEERDDIISVIQDCTDKCNIKDCEICEHYKVLIKRIKEIKH